MYYYRGAGTESHLREVAGEDLDAAPIVWAACPVCGVAYWAAGIERGAAMDAADHARALAASHDEVAAALGRLHPYHPVRLDDAEQLGTPPADAARQFLPAPPGRPVLVVDDEPDIREVIRIALERAGFRVI